MNADHIITSHIRDMNMNKRTNPNNNIKKALSIITLLFLLAACSLAMGCDLLDSSDNAGSSGEKTEQASDAAKDDENAQDENQDAQDAQDPPDSEKTSDRGSHEIDPDKIPKWDGEPSVEINGGDPSFTDSELSAIKKQTEEDLSSLDSQGRCGDVSACVSSETMPEGERGSIGMIRPAGWHLVKYDFVDGKYLYNRCHLIGWQLTGLNAEERNLITGTRYLNVDGMLPYENRVADFAESSDLHVAYRVEPVYKGDELIARGVHIEAESIEDKGESLAINVYCYNVQPYVDINYKTGESSADSDAPASAQPGSGSSSGNQSSSNSGSGGSSSDGSGNSGSGSQNANAGSQDNTEQTYILNTNTKRYHLQGCRSLSQMKDKNKRTFHGSKKELSRMGYKPCGNCHP